MKINAFSQFILKCSEPLNKFSSRFNDETVNCDLSDADYRHPIRYIFQVQLGFWIHQSTLKGSISGVLYVLVGITG